MPYESTTQPPLAHSQATNNGQQIMSTNTLDHDGPAYDLPGNHHKTNAGGPFARINLTPIAAPSALGLAAFASSTFIVATWLASWYGNELTPFALWPFLLTFGGFGQFAAGMWSFNSRDTLATVFHTMWGAFWIAVSLSLAVIHPDAAVGGIVNRYAYNDAWAIWMVPLAILTYVLTAAATFRDLIWASSLFTLATGSLLGVLGWFISETAILKLMGYFWIVSSALATYRVALYVLHEANPKREVLPRFAHSRHHAAQDKGYASGFHEPGVVAGDGIY
ncbi:hypothetical protein HKX48_007813 [Thoreauomyces humboldtii]|nr:hypothetical protein HKX48_007813 [Thoreauomyces humboldtii]